MNQYVLKKIETLPNDSYQVVLESKETVVCFQFNVEGSDIEVVTWEDDFSEFMNNCTGGASPLFEAVLKFHQAKNFLNR